MLSNFLFSTPKNVGNAKCRPTIDRVSTNYWPIHRSSIDQLSTNYRQSVGEVSAKCRRSVGERKAILAETHLERLSTVSRPSVDRLSTNYRPLCRPSVNRVSTECRPSVDRVSTAISTAISTDISVDITHSKQDPNWLTDFCWECPTDPDWEGEGGGTQQTCIQGGFVPRSNPNPLPF